MMAIGLDVHKIRTTVACLNLETQEMGRPYSVPTDQLARHLSELPGDKRMVLEAGSTSVFVARELESCGLDVIVVDAFKAHRLLEGRRGAKTDKLDAQGLAWLLGGRLLEHAQVWVCDEATHQLRELTRTREKLTRVNVILGRQGANCPYRDLSGAAAQAWLDQLVAQLPEPLQAALRALCATLQALAAQLKQLEQALTRVAPQHPQHSGVRPSTGRRRGRRDRRPPALPLGLPSAQLQRPGAPGVSKRRAATHRPFGPAWQSPPALGPGARRSELRPQPPNPGAVPGSCPC